MTRPGAQELEAFLLKAFPRSDGKPYILVESIDEKRVRTRLPARPSHLRPGDTVSGPVQMTLADTAAWLLIMHNLGLRAAPSVTSSLNINFLARPAAADLLVEGQLVKLGRTLSVTEVKLYSVGRDEPVALATVTYAVRLAAEPA